jgi:ABC-type nitrate/sulfonate/bicarbonate transport system substrate-binding protein
VKPSRLVVVFLVVALTAGACAGGGAASPAARSAAASPAAPSGGSSAAPSTPPSRVRLALDWTPNTNHSGFFVARHEGWYRDAAIDLQVLPYSGTTPEALVAAHQAECGISFQDSLTFAAAAGAPVVSVMAILEHAGSEIAVLDSSPIKRPRDLDGKIYGGFGYPNEEPTVRAVIRHDGGKGTFKVVTLDSAAYEALYAKRVDFTITFRAQEGVEAALRGIRLRYFPFTAFGFPDFYQVVLACDRDWLAREPDAARRFVAATYRGFEVAATDAERAAADLIAENPGVFDANPALPRASARFLVDNGLFRDASGRLGFQTLEQWRGYSGFLYDQGLLVDANGKPLTVPPDYAALFTNEYLP